MTEEKTMPLLLLEVATMLLVGSIAHVVLAPVRHALTAVGR